MGKMILVAGPNGSGKSDYAEKIIGGTGKSTEGSRLYIATMIPQTEDNFRHIEKHIQRREQYGFQTIEEPCSLESVPASEDSVVLLEDISNLLANNMFGGGNADDTTPAKEVGKQVRVNVYEDVKRLVDRVKLVVAVTISGLESGDYDEETTAYIDSLNCVNEKLAEFADAVVEMRERRPVYLKGLQTDAQTGYTDIQQGGDI